jgi:drug/metabolite transporter (DMT)-like permease
MSSLTGPSNGFARLSAPVQGALLMVAAALCFSFMNFIIRAVSTELSPIQIAFFRNLFALLFMMPWLASHGVVALKTTRFSGHVVRACFGLGAMLCWFSSVTLLPLAEAVSLNFTVPMFATIGAALFLGEIVRVRRWSATIAGFIGVLIILRPGFTEFTPAMALPMIAALFMAASTLLVKSLSRSEAPGAIVLYMNLLLTPLSFVPALWVWRWPSLEALGLMAVMGLMAAIAHLAMTGAYTKADASAIMPFDYARLPFVAAIAFVAFGEVPDLWTWVGAAVIAASAIYIARREARVAAERRASLAAGHAPRDGV